MLCHNLWHCSNIKLTLCQCIKLPVTPCKNETFSQCCFTAEPGLSVPILKRLHWLPVKFRIHFEICAITFRTLKENQPAYLADLLVRPKCSKYLRSTNLNRFVVPRIKTKTGSRAFSISGPALWNALPVPIRNAKTILTFRELLKSHLFVLAFPS